MSKTTEENIENRQAELSELAMTAAAVAEAIENAESCETPSDFDANIDEAIEGVEVLAAALKELRE